MRSAMRAKGNTISIIISFIALYCWYTSYFHDLEHSPVASIAASHGASLDVWSTIFVLATMASIAFCLFAFTDQNRPSARPVWLAVHILAFGTIQLIPFMPWAWGVYATALIAGLCLGAIVNRVVYSVFFFIIGIHPVRAVVLAYIFIQAYVHLYTIVPIVSMPGWYFAIECATLLVSLFFSYRFDGNEMEIRRLLPENTLNLRDIGPTLVFLALVQVGFSLYDSFIWPELAKSVQLDVVQIIPNALTLAGMYFLSRYLTAGKSLRLLLIFFACGVLAYLLLEGPMQRIAVDAFMQPAYLFSDLFFVWLMNAVYFTYGNKFMRLRACFCAILIPHFLAGVLVDTALGFPFGQLERAMVTLACAFLLLLLLPAVERFLKSAHARRMYAERGDESEIVLPPERPDIAALCAEIERMPQMIAPLAQAERAMLAYMLDGHDVDVAAHFIGIAISEARELQKAVCAKCGVASRSELLMLAGARAGSDAKQEILSALLSRYNLTQREEEVCLLLLGGFTLRQIAGMLGVAYSTVNYYGKNIYKKLDISSRAELFARFGALPVGDGSQE